MQSYRYIAEQGVMPRGPFPAAAELAVLRSMAWLLTTSCTLVNAQLRRVKRILNARRRWWRRHKIFFLETIVLFRRLRFALSFAHARHTFRARAHPVTIGWLSQTSLAERRARTPWRAASRSARLKRFSLILVPHCISPGLCGLGLRLR